MLNIKYVILTLALCICSASQAFTLTKAGPLATYGLKDGDKILTVNGFDMNKAKKKDISRLFKKPGKKVVILERDGESITLRYVQKKI